MLKYLAMTVVAVIAGYTVLYGFEVKKEPNPVGFIAILTMAIVITALAFYVLFLKT